MSEKLRTPEHSIEPLDTSVEVKRQLERLEVAAKHEKSPDVQEIRHKVEQQAVSGKEISIGDKQEARAQSSIGMHKQLKYKAYQQTLARVQDQLSKPEQALSKLIHQPVVEKLSNVGAQTVGRPSGILGGGFAALVGGSLVLFISRQYGFEYNYLLFAALFIAGFALGILFELLFRLLKRRQQT